MYLTLEEVKHHLNINQEFTEDDSYIQGLMDAAEKVVERHIDNKLVILASVNGGSLPTPLMQAMKMLVGTWYENREAVKYAVASQVPLSYDYILSLYKNYSQQFNI